MLRKGDLLQNHQGHLAEIVTDSYRQRYMDPEDYDMVDAGMGHLAGSYGIAFNVMILNGPKQGQTFRLRPGRTSWKKIAVQGQ